MVSPGADSGRPRPGSAELGRKYGNTPPVGVDRWRRDRRRRDVERVRRDDDPAVTGAASRLTWNEGSTSPSKHGLDGVPDHARLLDPREVRRLLDGLDHGTADERRGVERCARRQWIADAEQEERGQVERRQGPLQRPGLEMRAD